MGGLWRNIRAADAVLPVLEADHKAGRDFWHVRGRCNGIYLETIDTPMGGVFGIYELLPAFVVSCIVIVLVSLRGKEPSAQMQAEFDQAKG